MTTAPSDIFRNHLVGHRFPQFSGTGGSVCSAPFVLNKDINTETDTTAADIIRPWEIFAGTLDGPGTPNIIPIGVPGEYSKLEIWAVSKTTLAAQTEPILSIYGRQSIPDAAKGNLPNAYDSNFPELNEWWNPLVFVDRAVDRLNSSTDEIGAGIPHVATAANTAAIANATCSYQLQALQFTLNMRAAHLADNQIGAGVGDNVAVYGTSLFCGPMTSLFLDGVDVIMATVHTGAQGSAGDTMLMGRFTG